MRTNIALAAALCLAGMTVAASAQGLSYESRGYGGPLYVGPNFQQGCQHAPPHDCQGPSTSERATPRRSRAAKGESAPVTCKRYVAAVGQTVSVPCD